MADFPPVYSHNNASGTSTGASIDISSCSQGMIPPAMSIVISATATVIVEASHDNVNWIDMSGGGFTANDSRDLVISYRFWRSRITANTGTVSTPVGPVPTQTGNYVAPHLATTIYNATSSL